MKVLVVSQYFWPEEFRINDLVMGLRELGHDITVLTGVPNYPKGKFYEGYGALRPVSENYQGVKVIRVPLIPRGGGGGLRLALNYLSFAVTASVLGPLRCRGKFDMIFVYEPSPITVGIPARILKKIKSAPLMFWVQDLWPESLVATGAVRAKWILRSVEQLVRWVYRGCDLILTQSRAFAAPITALGADAVRITYFPNSAEALYQPLTLPSDAVERGDMPAGFCVMFAGNIGAAQDFPTILAAAQKLRAHADIHWVVLGDGRMYEWVQSQVRELNLHGSVHLLGRRPLAAMPRYFSLADVMLVTLKKEPIFALTIPAKVQSYLACAKPIVAALDGEGADVILEAGAGLAAPAENATALADAVLALYKMTPDERASMGHRGREYFDRHFERNMLLQKLCGWIKQLTGTAT